MLRIKDSSYCGWQNLQSQWQTKYWNATKMQPNSQTSFSHSSYNVFIPGGGGGGGLPYKRGREAHRKF